MPDIDGLIPSALRQWATGTELIGSDLFMAFQPESPTLPHYRLFSAADLGDFVTSGGNYVNIQAFGALGNGTTDDTIAIQAALTAGAGKTVFFPVGRYKLSASLLIPANTRVLGCGPGSVLISQTAAWSGAAVMLRNETWAVTTNTDENIVIESMAFDWTGYLGSMGAAHSIQIRFTTGVKIDKCFFLRGGDAIAGIHCYDMGIENCTAYFMTNCIYDFWVGCKNIRLENCYGESADIVQMVNFNSTPSTIHPDPQVGQGFICNGNTFKCTDSGARAIFLTPLGVAGANTVRDVVISNNTLDGTIVIGGGDVQSVVVTGNTFTNTGNNSAVGIFNDASDTPTGFTCIGNVFDNATTVVGNLAVVRYSGDNYVIANNNFLGSAYYAAIDVASNVGVLSGNRGLPGTSTVFAVGQMWISSGSGLRVANAERMVWYTSDGDRVEMICQGDDNWRFTGTNASGAARNIFTIQNKSNTAPMRIVPDVDLGIENDLQFSFRGAASGVANSLAANLQVNGVDTDVAMRILGKGNKGILIDTFDGTPSTAMIPNGMFGVVNDGGTVTLVYNLAGVLKTVALT